MYQKQFWRCNYDFLKKLSVNCVIVLVIDAQKVLLRKYSHRCKSRHELNLHMLISNYKEEKAHKESFLFREALPFSSRLCIIFCCNFSPVNCFNLVESQKWGKLENLRGGEVGHVCYNYQAPCNAVQYMQFYGCTIDFWNSSGNVPSPLLPTPNMFHYTLSLRFS